MIVYDRPFEHLRLDLGSNGPLLELHIMQFHMAFDAQCIDLVQWQTVSVCEMMHAIDVDLQQSRL